MARNRQEALGSASSEIDIILLDLVLGADCSLDFLPELMDAAERARVLVLTGTMDPELHLKAVCLGAMGVLQKSEAPEVLLKAIRKVHAGEAWMNRTMMAAAMTRMRAHPTVKLDPDATKIAALTPRELQVIASLGEGRKNKEIAERLFISEKTVRHYLSSIFAKLGVTDRLELMIYAYRHGLVKVPSNLGVLTAVAKE